MPAQTSEILTLPLPPEGLSAAQYRELQTTLKKWEEDVRANARAFPARSYELGVEQTLTFLRMLGILGQTDLPPSGAIGPTKQAAVEWMQRYTLHEIDGALARYIDEIRSAALYGLRGAVNPTQVASWLYKATKDAGVNWRTVARTEMVRANAAGRLDAIAKMGYDQVWAPKHTGACKQCQRLLEGRAFDLDEVKNATNYGRQLRDWVACIPLHPHCRHVWLPYIEDVFDEAQADYDALADNGLDDKTLNEMFDSSGHLKPQYENDPRLLAYFEETGKTVDPLEYVLGRVIEKTRREEPPGLHHTSGRKNCGGCEFYDRPECRRYNWPVDRDELCATWEPKADVGKGFFDNPQAGLDPLIWTPEDRLRPDVRDRIVTWWRWAFTDNAPLWSHLYITGSAAARAWAGHRTAGDVDVQIVVDYAALREHHSEYAALSDPELHAALVTQIKASLEGVEAAPGLALDAFIRPERSRAQFAADVAGKGQGVYDVNRGRWLVRPPDEPSTVDVDEGEFLLGEGGQLAHLHPEWLKHARDLRDGMNEVLAAYDRSGDTSGFDELRGSFKWVHDLREREFSTGDGADGLGNFLWRYLVDFGPLIRVKHLLHDTPLAKVWPLYRWSDRDEVAKATPGPAATDAGAEHWITVHPNGPGTDGQPVLVRNSADGKSMVVIGGAGGHLDHLRIDRSRQIKPDHEPTSQGVEQAASEHEAQQKSAEQESAIEQAREHRDLTHSAMQEAQGRVEDLVKQMVQSRGATVGGEQVGWDQMSDQDRKLLVKRALNDSLYQSEYATGHDQRRADAPSGPIVVTPAPKEQKEPDPDAPERDPSEGPTDEEHTASERAPSPPPRLAMSTDEANALWEEHSGLTALRKRVRDANKVINGEKTPTDAAKLDWEPVDKPETARRTAALRAQEQINRELLGEVEAAQGRSKQAGREALVTSAICRGAFDAFDGLSYSVFGKTVLPTRLQELLGVNGTAQLLCHEFQERAKGGELQLDKLSKTIDDITDERQASLTDLDLNRARLAAHEAAAMGEEYSKSLAGESMATLTWTKSRQKKKLDEAASALGMAISGSEALHTIRAMLKRPVDKVRVDGFTTESKIRELAAKANVQLRPSDIVRNGAGNYSLHLEPDRIRDLLDNGAAPDDQLREQLSKIRTGEDLDRELETASHPPGYTRTLDRAQAQGSMFLRAAGSGVLAFAPGVGKTDTAIAAALEQMNANPGHRALIVAPKTALAGTWAKTIQQAAPGKSLQIIGRKGPGEGEDASKYDWEGAGNLTGKARAGTAPADFNIISFDTLKKNPELVAELGHTMVIADEAQYAKSPTSQRLEGLDKAAEGVQHRWALTGTPLEKNMGELHTLMNWAKPGQYGSRAAFRDRYDKINQYDHLTAEEKVQQFREGVGDGMFFQSQDMSQMPAAPDLQWEDAPLTEGHSDAYRQAVNDYNEQWKARRETPEGVEKPALPAFGGREVQMAALMKPAARGYLGTNARANKIADLVASNPAVDFKGFQGHATHPDGENAGTYAPKSIIFGQQTQPLAPIRDELSKRGTHKVFYTDGSVADNDKRLAAFMAHKGPAVLITSDTNKTARSLQFGDNGGKFQHGATQVIHADLPLNNADLSQRTARAWRRGAQAPVSQHILYSDTPVERTARDQLSQEQRTISAVGNPEDRVSGRETIDQKLRARGQRRLASREEQTDG